MSFKVGWYPPQKNWVESPQADPQEKILGFPVPIGLIVRSCDILRISELHTFEYKVWKTISKRLHETYQKKTSKNVYQLNSLPNVNIH